LRVNDEELLLMMAWAVPQYTRKQVDIAGNILRSYLTSFEQLEQAFRVINNWRSSRSSQAGDCLKVAARYQKPIGYQS
jgi:hypothetical protein